MARSQGVDGSLIDELDQVTHRLRLLDRRVGAASVLDQISAKTKIAANAGAVGELVGKDEAEICIYYLNEMGVNPNVDVVGTLPAEFAPPTDIVAFISTRARNAVAAKALVDYLASLESKAVYEKDGLVPVP